MNFKELPNERKFDAIVIGSGLGGMCSAALLAKINKKKVLVLEQHSEFGGLTHEFKRGPFSWDVGLHYVGDLDNTVFDRITRSLFDFITDGNLKWNKMPIEFDHFITQDVDIKIPAGVKNFINALVAKFPDSKKEIKRYVKDVVRIKNWYLAYFFANYFSKPIDSFFKLLKKIHNKKALLTLQEYLDKYITDSKLKTLLSMRWGNYGIPPEKVAFATHALIEEHYLDGGCFPDGGASVIGGYIEHVIESNGGTTLTNAKVTEILLDDNKAYGVKVKNMNGAEDKVEEFYAPMIISDAGAKNTYLKLLPQSLNLDIQQKLNNFQSVYSGLNLYLGLKDSPKTLGINGENFWIFDNIDFSKFDDSCTWLYEDNKEPVYCFLSFPSMKAVNSDKKIAHTADIITVVPYRFFSKWKDQKCKERSADYYQMKEKLSQSILKMIEKHIPGFSNLITYHELATPLTFENYIDCNKGCFYGLPEIPDRYKLKDLQVATPIKNLYLTGTDILSNGIVPAIMSGMGTVVNLNGFMGIMKVMSKVTTYKPNNKDSVKNNKFVTDVTFSPYSNKKVGTVVSTQKVGENLVEIEFAFKEKLNWQAGQHVKMNVGLGLWRAYSVAKCSDNKLMLIVDTRPNGVGVNYIKNLIVGNKVIFRMPINDLVLKNNNKDKVFIASGTGIVPFISMVDQLLQEHFSGNVSVIFGCLNEADNFIARYFDAYKDNKNVKINIFIENIDQNVKQEKDYYNILPGRVTQMFTADRFDYQNTDFYLCGHPNMVNATIELIRKFGGNNIYY